MLERASEGAAVALCVAFVAACSSEPASRRAHDAATGPTSRDAAPAAADDGLPPHHDAPDLASAIRALLPATSDIRVVGFGELHARVDRPSAARSALARFGDEVLPVLAPRLSDLVVETWLFDPRCGGEAQAATAKVEATMQRPATTKSELGTVVGAARAAGVQPHAMRLTCDDWRAIAPPGGEVDYEKMLDAITRELGRIATEAVTARDAQPAARRLVATYGGALHNDLYPNAGTADWSFARAVDAATGGHYLEIDLVVPEYAAEDPLSQAEPWFPLVARAAPDHVTIIERGARSYVVILPRAP